MSFVVLLMRHFHEVNCVKIAQKFLSMNSLIILLYMSIILFLPVLAVDSFSFEKYVYKIVIYADKLMSLKYGYVISSMSSFGSCM